MATTMQFKVDCWRIHHRSRPPGHPSTTKEIFDYVFERPSEIENLNPTAKVNYAWIAVAITSDMNPGLSFGGKSTITATML